MINPLIKPPIRKNKTRNSGDARRAVMSYIKSLAPDQREKLKVMLDKNYSCCAGIARALGIDESVFQAELKGALSGE